MSDKSLWSLYQVSIIDKSMLDLQTKGWLIERGHSAHKAGQWRPIWIYIIIIIIIIINTVAVLLDICDIKGI